MRCTNCHAGSDVGRVPVAAKSVIPGPNAGSLDAYGLRKLVMGPFSERFGGLFDWAIQHFLHQ